MHIYSARFFYLVFVCSKCVCAVCMFIKKIKKLLVMCGLHVRPESEQHFPLLPLFILLSLTAPQATLASYWYPAVRKIDAAVD